MPRVTRDAEVTLVTLVYRSTMWLDFVMDGVERAKSNIRYRWFIAANDAPAEVSSDPRVELDFRNENPAEFYINRVYRAWNVAVREAPTQLVVLLNNDMYVSDYWLDQLLWLKKSQPKTVPTSLLVESGRVPSAMPEHVMNFGMNPEEFKREEFAAHAATIRKPAALELGRLYMPIIVDRQEFLDIGGYPDGNPPGTTGDKDLIRRYTEAGFTHQTCMGSIVYHCVMGEQNWP